MACTNIIDSYTTHAAFYNVYGADQWGMGQALVIGSNTNICTSKFYLQRNGSPTGNVYSKLYACDGTPGTDGKPTGLPILVSSAVDITTISDVAFEWVPFNGTAHDVSAGNYCLVVEFSGGSVGNTLLVGYDDTTMTHAGNICYVYNNAWASGSQDCEFYWYSDVAAVGGIPATMEHIILGM